MGLESDGFLHQAGEWQLSYGDSHPTEAKGAPMAIPTRYQYTLCVSS